MNSASMPSATSALKNPTSGFGPSSVLCPPSSATSGLQPIVPALALALRARAAFPFEFLRIIATRLRAHLGWQTAQAAQVRAIDDELEAAAQSLVDQLPTFKRAFANDTPAIRRACLAELGRYLRAARHTHAATETRAAALTPTGAEHLLRD